MVVILLDNPHGDSENVDIRGRELPCYPPFAEFLAQELLPWARQKYHITSNPDQIVVGGSSYGGLASMYVGLKHPEIFGNVLSQSGSFWWKPEGELEHEWLTKQFAATYKLPLNIYMDVGILEDEPLLDKGPSQLVVNRHMRTVLQAKGYPVHYCEYGGGHDYLCWQGTLADGLISLMGR